MRPVVLTLTGPSCSGKSFLERRLAESHGYGKVVSHTTREPRAGEVDGKDYFFVTEEEFMTTPMVEDVTIGKTLYGMAVDEMKAALERGNGRMVVVVEPIGAAQVRKHCRANNIACVSAWVACDVAEQARRFITDRVPNMKPQAAAERLGIMMGLEATWRTSAAYGWIYQSSMKYDLEFWEAGPETEDIYIRTINTVVNRYSVLDQRIR